MIISRKGRYGIIGLAKRACFFCQVVFDVKVHNIGFGRVSFSANESGGSYDGRESSSYAIKAGSLSA